MEPNLKEAKKRTKNKVKNYKYVSCNEYNNIGNIASVTSTSASGTVSTTTFAYTDATHGMTLAAVSLPYYRYIMPYGLKKFKRFAVNVWNISGNGKTDEQIANEGLGAMETWMRELGLIMSIAELGATEDMIDGITNGTFIMEGGYKVLTKDEIKFILKESMR